MPVPVFNGSSDFLSKEIKGWLEGENVTGPGGHRGLATQ
jgi:hypothetical protein